MLDNSAARNLLTQLMTIYISPELRKRQHPQNFNLRAAQIIFYDDSRPCQVRINDEINGIAKVKLKSGVSKKKNEPIFENEVEGLSEINLTEYDDPNCAHVTLVRIRNTWTIAFDFRYNKGLAQKHIKTAKQFYETAEFSYQKENWAPLIDNLFSAAELAAKSMLLLMPGTGFTKKSRHRSIQFRFNKFADLGNVPEEFRVTLNKLSELRNKARYLKGALNMDRIHLESFLRIVEKMIQDAEKRATMRIQRPHEFS